MDVGHKLMFSILGRYLFVKFVKSIVTVFALAMALVYVLDMIELTRISNDTSASSMLLSAQLALFRTPVVAEQILPFSALFGALATFLSLARSRELVIARAAGMSVWRFLFPAFIAALILGIISVIAFNPLATTLKVLADQETTHTVTASDNEPARNIWMRQKSIDGEAILRAGTANLKTAKLEHVTAFEFDTKGNFLHRVEALSANLLDGYWAMNGVRILSPGVPPELHDTYELPTFLTANQIRQSLSDPETISFYDLLAWARATEAAGLDASRYFQQYFSLLARPLMMAAMLMLAATVSLRFSRTGAQFLSILGAIASGFVLFVSNKVLGDVGAAGILPPLLTSFLFPVIASLLCTLILLYQEDG
jgi:lipopolysaccharide export system permease protein